MLHAPAVAQRAARQVRRVIPAVAALAIAGGAVVASAPPSEAAYAPRVVIVVGPAGSATSDYLSKARAYASQAKAYGATVDTVLHPHATWKRVMAAAQGANVFIYLGHGNGWPSPYAPFQTRTKDGLGLNPYDGAGVHNVAYYGEAFIRDHIRLAPRAIVLFNRLCYASGNGEPGFAEPSWSTAVKRVDNYAAGFLDAGAASVLADGHTTLGYELGSLFARSRPVVEMWREDPDANGHIRAFDSNRTPGARIRLDPDRASAGFYRSLVTRATPTTGAIRISALWGSPRDTARVRARPSVDARVVVRLGSTARYVVRGALVRDESGRTWAPVMTRGGKRGFVAAWTQQLWGTVRTRTRLVLRDGPSTGERRVGSVAAGVRVTVLRSRHDRADRVWLKVRTPAGRTGWLAAWLTKP